MERSELLALANKLDADDSEEAADFLLKHFVSDRGEIHIEGDDNGLKHLASQILRLLARDQFDGIHQDFDIGVPSDEGSCRMTILRKEAGD